MSTSRVLPATEPKQSNLRERRRPRTARLLLALFIALVACSAVASAGTMGGATATAIPTGNLVQNPGAEASPGAPDGAVTFLPAGWATTGSLSVWMYAAAESDRPTKAFAATIGGGMNMFFGGTPSVPGTPTASQKIDVSGAAAEIDAGGVGATLEAFIGGYSVSADLLTVTARFVDVAGAPLGSIRVGPVTREDRKLLTVLLKRSAQASVPKGTRSINIVIAVTSDNNGSNGVFADNISLTLGKAPVAPPPAASATLVASCSNKTLVATVRLAKGVAASSVTFLVNGKAVSIDKKAPFTARIGTSGLPAQLKVTARVVVAGKRSALTQALRRC